MKAIGVNRAGLVEPENDRRLPTLSPGLVRVRAKYAGVGFADVMAAKGGYPLAPKRPSFP
jgi:NADPH:quinone reductase-like Zn-dependent oxidoreductase